MRYKGLIAEVESKISETETNKITYAVRDMSIEIQTLTGVGYKSILEAKDYQLFQKGDMYALLIDFRVIQGPASYVYDELATSNVHSKVFPDLYHYLLELVRTEGIA